MVLTYLSGMSLQSVVLQDLGPVYSTRRMSVEEFEAYALNNPDMVLELEVDGRVKIMSPVGGKSGNRENQFNADLTFYERTHTGLSYSGSTGFILPDGSTRAPDAAFVSAEKLSHLSDEEQEKFLRVVPDFVVEVRSATDTLQALKDKMNNAWIANGVLLAWLVDVQADKLWVYRADGSVELVTPLDRTLSGEDAVPGFTFNLTLLH